MKLLSALVLCILLAHCTYAQETPIGSKRIGIQMNLSLAKESSANYRVPFPIDGGEILTYQLTNQDILNIGAFFRSEMKRNWFAEYGLIALNVEKNDDIAIIQGNIVEPANGSTRKSVDIRLRAEFGKWLNGDAKKIRFGVGAGIDPFGVFHRIIPATSFSFPFTSQRIGAEVRLIPRMAYQLSSKLMLELKLPVRTYTWYAERTRLDNPLQPADENIHKKLYSKFDIGALEIAVGLSVKL